IASYIKRQQHDPTPFPYTTLFRSPRGSLHARRSGDLQEREGDPRGRQASRRRQELRHAGRRHLPLLVQLSCWTRLEAVSRPGPRSEEHTSELQSRENLVCRLLLEK